MSVIYKYPLEVTGSQTVTLPQDATPLSVGVQWFAGPNGNEHNVVLWVQTENPPL